jgi:single-strand DNA-binding protein
MNVNKVVIIGKLLKDANVGITKNKKNVSNLEVITDESYISADGTKIEKSERHRVVAWGKQAELCKDLKKDQQVYIEGKNQTRKTDIGFVNEIVAKEIQISK